MPQSILVQVGQCGNQVGFRFWESTIKEYTAYRNKLTDEQICYFLNPQKGMSTDKPLDECYSARGILVDMEEGVISEGCRGSLKKLFTKKQILTDVSGSGNNWAMGNKYYATNHCDKIEELFRKQAEECDKLESFLFTFAVGGGTGSGLGTAILEYVHTMFPGTPKLVFPVYPSLIDDVITSPYNSVLANNKLAEFADLIVPFENQVLTDICMKVDKSKSKFHVRGKYNLTARLKNPKNLLQNSSKPFDDMNDLIVSVISDFTSSSRFPGTLNIDINELVLNMTPYPNLKYCIPSTSPFILVPEDSKMEHVFSDLFTADHCLMRCNVINNLHLAAAVIGRGSISVVELQNNINRLASNLRFTNFNDVFFKTGLCNFAAANRHVGLLKLSNTCSIADNLDSLRETFQRMYRKKAHLHHFYQVSNMEEDDFSYALSTLCNIITEYRNIKNTNEVSRELQRLVLV